MIIILKTIAARSGNAISLPLVNKFLSFIIIS